MQAQEILEGKKKKKKKLSCLMLSGRRVDKKTKPGTLVALMKTRIFQTYFEQEF